MRLDEAIERVDGFNFDLRHILLRNRLDSHAGICGPLKNGRMLANFVISITENPARSPR